VMLPFWTSFLLRVYAWKGLLSEGGWVAKFIAAIGIEPWLTSIGLIPAPGQLMNTPLSLDIGMVYTYLPFMVLPLFANLSKMDIRLLEAAYDLGATPWEAFWRVTVPLMRPTILLCTLLSTIAALRVLEEVLVLTNGGPLNSTYTALMYVYAKAFQGFDFNYGLASAAGLVVAVVALALSAANFRLIRGDTEGA